MSRINFMLSVLTAIGCTFLATRSTAAPVNYSESINGDLPDMAVPLPTFVLDVGVNTIAGTFGTAADGALDFDSFAFIIPTGMEMYFGRVQTADVGVGDILSVSWRLKVGSPDFDGGTFIEFVGLGAPDVDFVNAVPLSAGVYNLSASSYVHPEVPLPARADFTFTLRVREEVPEPGFYGLVMIACATLARRPR
jgi:hypothetical protein